MDEVTHVIEWRFPGQKWQPVGRGRGPDDSFISGEHDVAKMYQYWINRFEELEQYGCQIRLCEKKEIDLYTIPSPKR